MIKKIKQSTSEKILLIFIILLGLVTFGTYFKIKNKCLFIKSYNLEKLTFDKPENIAILNAQCGNIIIELYPEISPNSVKRFKALIKSGIKIIIQPGGSIRDKEVIEAANKANIKMVLTGTRHFNH